jgi:hypothetical protein
VQRASRQLRFENENRGSDRDVRAIAAMAALRLALCAIIDAIEHWIFHPFIYGRFPPAGAAYRNPDLSWKGAGLHLPVQGCPAEAGTVEHGIEAEDAIGGFGRHGMILVRL